MKKFLIVNPFGIGDVLFTTPVVRAIKDGTKDAIISYWCNERVKDILKNNPHIDKIFALSRGDLKRIYRESNLEGIRRFLSLLYQIKKEKFDISLDFSLDYRYSLVSKLLGIKRRIGFNYKKRGRFLTEKIEISGYQSNHIVEYYLDLLKFLNIEPKSNNLELRIPKADRVRAKRLLSYSGIRESDLVVGIAAAAGASWGKDASIKHWPAIRFAKLADRITSELGAKIVILGDVSEKQLCDVIVNMMKNKPIDLAGKTSLEDLAAVISSLNLLVTNDGGPLHMAVATGIKTVSIFGPVDDKVYGPYPASQNHSVIKKDLPCRPCYQNFRLNPCEKERECINSIDSDEVFAAVKRLL